jgi:hypothetical protein
MARVRLRGGRHEHVARARAKEAGRLEAGRTARRRRHALCGRQLPEELGLGLLLSAGNRDKVTHRPIIAHGEPWYPWNTRIHAWPPLVGITARNAVQSAS